eukprot:jgi/Orpsp1_1/1184455/evm.model.c7180000089595.1
MYKYQFLFIFLLLIEYIFAEVVEIDIESWESLINYSPEDKDNHYVFNIVNKISISSSSNDFLSKYKKISIRGKNEIQRFVCISYSSSSDKNISYIFEFSSQTDELDFTLENIKFQSCKIPQVVMEGKNVSVSLINDEFIKNNDSALQATSVKSVMIKNCKFSENTKGTRPQIYIENKEDFRTLIYMEDSTGTKNTNEIKDVTSSGGWGYFSNSEIHFKNIISDGNTSDSNGAVFNIRNCTGDINNSEFKNSKFNGKGVIYHY